MAISNRSAPRLLGRFGNADTNDDHVVDAPKVEACGTNMAIKIQGPYAPNASQTYQANRCIIMRSKKVAEPFGFGLEFTSRDSIVVVVIRCMNISLLESQILEIAMNIESLSVTTPISITANSARRLFLAHVAALAITAAVAIPLLLGTATIPAWIAMTYCIIIAAVALVFIGAAIGHARKIRGQNLSGRFELLIVASGLSIIQLIFILPILICEYAPTLRL